MEGVPVIYIPEAASWWVESLTLMSYARSGTELRSELHSVWSDWISGGMEDLPLIGQPSAMRLTSYLLVSHALFLDPWFLPFPKPNNELIGSECSTKISVLRSGESTLGERDSLAWLAKSVRIHHRRARFPLSCSIAFVNRPPKLTQTTSLRRATW